MDYLEFKKKLAKNFGNQAKSYEEKALVQKHSALILTSMVFDFLTSSANKSCLEKSRLLDIGSGCGFVSELLRTKEDFKDFSFDIFELDISHSMLENKANKNSKTHKIIADAEFLPFVRNSFDVITSSFCFQWLALQSIFDYKNFFQKIDFALKNQALLAIAVPCHGSFSEIAKVTKNEIFRFLNLPKAQDFITGASSAGLVLRSFEQQEFKQKFSSVFEALKWFREIGAGFNNLSPLSINSSNKKAFGLSTSSYSDRKKFILENSNNSSISSSKSSFFLDWKILYLIIQKP